MSLRYAIATPSYAGDFERCRLLCASIDRFVTGHTTHYLLVEDRETALFAPLAGPRRQIVAESALLPGWLRAHPDPLSLGRRRVWTGLGALARGVPPLRGWHAQQLRKFGFARGCDEDVVVFADSDLIFMRPFDIAETGGAGGVRLYRGPGGVTAAMAEHVAWCAMAARLFGLSPPALPADDFIGHLVSWRRDVVLAMCAHVEARTGRHWVAAIASQRRFSEYLIYGCFVERVLGLGAAGHRIDEREFCKAYWGGDTEGLGALRSAEDVLGPGQVAVGVQSFIGQPMSHLRELFERQAGRVQPARPSSL